MNNVENLIKAHSEVYPRLLSIQADLVKAANTVLVELLKSFTLPEFHATTEGFAYVDAEEAISIFREEKGNTAVFVVRHSINKSGSYSVRVATTPGGPLWWQTSMFSEEIALELAKLSDPKVLRQRLETL